MAAECKKCPPGKTGSKLRVITSTPARLAPFPPPGYAAEHRVKCGENWSSISRKIGRSDPWELIEFNFATRNPAEVNYYLGIHVGCESSEDGKNYRFCDQDLYGKIYLPPRDWQPKIDRYLRHLIVAAVGHPAINHVQFRRGGQRVSPDGLRAVANKVIDGEIRVLQSSSLTPGSARYFSERNRIELARGAGVSLESKALIVHECVHALFDMEYRSMTVGRSEGLAYVAQSIYAMKRSGKRDERLTANFPKADDPKRGDKLLNATLKDAVYQQAWKIAELIVDGKSVPAGEWSLLDTAVSMHPEYRGDFHDTAVFNGL